MLYDKLIILPCFKVKYEGIDTQTNKFNSKQNENLEAGVMFPSGFPHNADLAVQPAPEAAVEHCLGPGSTLPVPQ